MDAKARRKQIREQMQKRHDEAYKRKDDSGKFKTIFAALALDKIFKCGEGDHSLDFIPYVAGPNDPHTAEGEWTYNLDVFVHRKIGVNEDDYLCLNLNYGLPCPICEYQAKLQKQDDYDEDEVKALRPTRRVIYNVWCHDNDKEERRGVLLFNSSQYRFSSPLTEQSKKKKGGGYVYFADPDDGKIVSFRRIGMGPRNTQFVAFTFEDREGAIPDDILNQAVCLDKLLHIPTYDEIEKAFFGGEKGKEDSEESTSEDDVPEPEDLEGEETKETEETEEESKEDECPSGYEFGVDFSAYDECDDCDVRKECRAKKKEAPKEKEAPPSRRPREDERPGTKGKETGKKSEPLRRRR